MCDNVNPIYYPIVIFPFNFLCFVFSVFVLIILAFFVACSLYRLVGRQCVLWFCYFLKVNSDYISEEHRKMLRVRSNVTLCRLDALTSN